MTYTINPIIHNTIADSIIKDLITKSSKYYYFLGKTLPYNSGVETTTVPTSDYSYELSTRREIIELKQITSNDISYVIPRYNWISGTVYAQYDDAIDISSLNFYVLTSNYNVYKCLDNNYGSTSTVMPTGTDTDPFITSDGYKWKFMLTLPLSLRNKFLTIDYMPVTTAIKSAFYNDNGIDTVEIINGGTGYSSTTSTLTVESSTGTGAVLTPVVVDGVITDVIINNPGNGYTYANVTPSGNGVLDTDAIINVIMNAGSLDTIQANVELLAVDGAIDCIKVTNGGVNYGSATVSIDGDGTGCTATVTISGSQISAINITNRGQGYTYANVTITGNGTGAEARAIMSPKGGHGKDAVTELFADSLLFFSNISTEKNNGFAMNNDYRQFGILKNPNAYNSTIQFNDRFGSTCHVLTGPVNVSKFPLDTQLVDNHGKKYTIIAVESTKMLVQSYDNMEPTVGLQLTNPNNGEVFSFTAITTPQVDKYSGKILYIDNRAAFFQTEDQSISFQTIIKF